MTLSSCSYSSSLSLILAATIFFAASTAGVASLSTSQRHPIHDLTRAVKAKQDRTSSVTLTPISKESRLAFAPTPLSPKQTQQRRPQQLQEKASKLAKNKETVESVIGPQTTSPWPLFRKNIGETGLSTFAGPLDRGMIDWQFLTTANAITSTPVVTATPVIDASGNVYCAGWDGLLYSFTSSGTFRWSAPLLDVNLNQHNGVNPAAVRSDGSILVTSYNGDLAAINANTGSELWFTPTPNTASTSLGSLTIGTVDGHIYVPYSNIFMAYDQVGNGLWSFGGPTFNYTFQSPPSINSYNEIILTFADTNTVGSHIYAISADGTTLLWGYDLPGYGFESPLIDSNDNIYYYVDSELVKLDSLGNALFDVIIDGGVGGFYGNMAINPAQNTLYIPSLNGNLYFVNANNGALLKKFLTGSPLTTSPSVDSAGVIYLNGNDNYFYSILSTGTLNWKLQLNNFRTQAVNWQSSPALGSNGMLYVGSTDGNIYAVKSSPSLTPTTTPSAKPTALPSFKPTAAPVATTAPSAAPTAAPVDVTSEAPTAAPSAAPVATTTAPTAAPVATTTAPTATPTMVPVATTIAPSVALTAVPVAVTSVAPTAAPVATTTAPTRAPTAVPVAVTSVAPTSKPSAKPASGSGASSNSNESLSTGSIVAIAVIVAVLAVVVVVIVSLVLRLQRQKALGLASKSDNYSNKEGMYFNREELNSFDGRNEKFTFAETGDNNNNNNNGGTL